jgi:hypothetical protein
MALFSIIKFHFWIQAGSPGTLSLQLTSKAGLSCVTIVPAQGCLRQGTRKGWMGVLHQVGLLGYHCVLLLWKLALVLAE